jgi:ABC-type glycerol-3-phosphate transport system substrate-binding protein
MRIVRVTCLALAVLLAAAPLAMAGAKTITLWYPAGDITAGAAHFSDKTLFADFEAKTGIKVEAVRSSPPRRGGTSRTSCSSIAPGSPAS